MIRPLGVGESCAKSGQRRSWTSGPAAAWPPSIGGHGQRCRVGARRAVAARPRRRRRRASPGRRSPPGGAAGASRRCREPTSRTRRRRSAMRRACDVTARSHPAPTEHLTVVQVSVSVCGARSTGSGFVVADGLHPHGRPCRGRRRARPGRPGRRHGDGRGARCARRRTRPGAGRRRRAHVDRARSGTSAPDSASRSRSSVIPTVARVPHSRRPDGRHRAARRGARRWPATIIGVDVTIADRHLGRSRRRRRRQRRRHRRRPRRWPPTRRSWSRLPTWRSLAASALIPGACIGTA